MEAPGGGEWGFYDAQLLPALVEWLESGSDAEQDLADAIYESFQHAMPSLQVHSQSSILRAVVRFLCLSLRRPGLKQLWHAEFGLQCPEIRGTALLACIAADSNLDCPCRDPPFQVLPCWLIVNSLEDDIRHAES